MFGRLLPRAPRGEDVYRYVDRVAPFGDGLVLIEDEPFLELHPHRARLRLWGDDPTVAIDAMIAFARVIVRERYVELELARAARAATGVRMLGLAWREGSYTAEELAALARFLPADLVGDGPTHAARAAARLPASARARALRAAIVTAPDDDAPRRVLADHWLELGDPRGELIALQCEPCSDRTRRRARDERVAELLDAHEDAWLAPYDLAGAEATWTRGFVEHVTATAVQLLRGWSELVADMPIRRVSVWSTDNAGLDELLGRPWPASITRLALYDMRDLAHMELLLAAPALPQLEEIYFSTPDVTYDDAHLDRLVAGGRALRAVSVRGGELSTAALARALAARSWRALALPYCNFGPTAAEAFAAATNQVDLAELRLTGNPLGDEGVAALAGVAALRELRLGRTSSGPRGLRALAACRALRALALCSNELGVAEGEALAAFPGGQLRELHLHHDELGDDETGFGDAGAHALASSEALAGLEALTARQIGVSGEGALALLEATGGALVRLDLGHNALGPGASRVVEARRLATVQTLELADVGLDGEAAELLARRTDLTELRELVLDSNPLGARGARALAAAPGLGQLDVLWLRACRIDDDDALTALRARFGHRVKL